MEKLGFISDAQTWLALRDIRYRIAHEYLAGELAEIYAAMVTTGATEFRRLYQKITQLV